MNMNTIHSTVIAIIVFFGAISLSGCRDTSTTASEKYQTKEAVTATPSDETVPQQTIIEQQVGDELRRERIQINGDLFVVEVAETPRQHERGLSGHALIGDGEGMLFLFDGMESRTFWMKEMTFAIDILWIREGRIVGIERNIPPPRKETDESMLPRYHSSVPVDTVLEVRGGVSEERGYAQGMEVKIASPPSPDTGAEEGK